jgi:type IV secretion system protein VirB10
VPASQAGKRSFMETPSASGVVSSEAVTSASSPYVLQAGSIIPAALITGIRSDLPGQITAQVTQNVYDSPTGRLLLIPQGARLIGEYDSQVSAGQNRVLLAWDRLILPDGRSIRLERQPGADASGMAGLQDKTNYHWGNMMKAALVSTLLGMGTQLATQDDSALVQALRYGMQDSISQTGRQLVQRELGVAPTLTVRPGYPLRVIVTRDLVIEIASKER